MIRLPYRTEVVFVCAIAGSFAAMACSKSARRDEAGATKAPAAKTVSPKQANPLHPPGLATAMAMPGSKKITAIGANGKVKVLEVASGGRVLAETSTYIVNAEIPASAKAGSEGVVTINLSPKEGWHINQEFPTKLKINAPQGVSVETATQSAKEASRFDKDLAVFKVAFQPTEAGTKEFTADFRFAVCTDATCDPKKAVLSWSVPVAAAQQ